MYTATQNKGAGNMSIIKEFFGNMPEGQAVYAYKMTNTSGISVTVLSLGGIVQQIVTPDKNGISGDIVCGFDTVEGYLTGGGYHGAIIGRYGNRIADGKFTLGGKEYTLCKNENNMTHLHGGASGFNLKLWDVECVRGENAESLVLRTVSEDGEEGYPGRLDVKVTYTLGNDNSLSIRYEADSDADTIFNPTNHTYYNLKGYAGGSVLNTELTLKCASYNTTDDRLIPTGIAPVAGTEFDFTSPRMIARPYDHNFLRTESGFGETAYAFDRFSGRTLTLYTDMPAVQLYTAGCMNEPVPFKKGVPQRPLHAFCLETQFCPDSPNHPDFPSCVLPKGRHFDSLTKFVFGVIG